MQETLEVRLPAADLEVEVVLAVARVGSLLRFGRRRRSFLLCKARLGKGRNDTEQNTRSNEVGRVDHGSSSCHRRSSSVYARAACFNRISTGREEITAQQ